MFAALGRFVNRFPWYIIGAWVLLAVVVFIFAPKLTSTQDTSSFLPSKYESIKATDLQTKAFPTATQPGAILVFDRADGGKLTATDSAQIKSIVASLNGSPKLDRSVFIPGVAGQPSKDGIVEIATFGLSPKSSGFDDHAFKAVKKLRSEAKAGAKETDSAL